MPLTHLLHARNISITINMNYLSHFLFLLLFLVFAIGGGAAEFYADERTELIRLRGSLGSILNLHSNWTGPPCHFNSSRWIGITCSDSHVIGILLQGAQLTGTLPSSAFRNLVFLQELNLRSNALHGPLPTLEGLIRLQTILLSHNRFSGPIPTQFVDLPELRRLDLQDNLLNGTIPAFDQRGLTEFNVSSNFLEGEIPGTRALRRSPKSSYDHNSELCGEPLGKPCRRSTTSSSSPPPSSPIPNFRHAKNNWQQWWRRSIALIALAAVMVMISLTALFLICYNRYRRKNTTNGYGATTGGVLAVKPETKMKPSSRSTSTGDMERAAGLEFFDKELQTFNIDQLMRSTAELLGKGRLGTTFKAVLETGLVVAVKRSKEMSRVSQKDFSQQMRILGNIRHENLVEIISFYHSLDEKLVISEYVPGQNLFQLLHDNRGEGRVPLNWTARISIVIGIARGLAYLHWSLHSEKVPHANLKSTNVIVLHDEDHPSYTAKLSDYGFLPILTGQSSVAKLPIAKTPEFCQGKKLTSKADVYCFGLIMLEVITGRVSGDIPGHMEIKWSTNILDLEILTERDAHVEMMKLTEIALECCALEPERRPRMTDLLTRIEEIKVSNNSDYEVIPIKL